jgi:MerR family mercuric resistance operon transcriptional regulator
MSRGPRCRGHLKDIRAKIADLRRLERLLATTVARCSGKMVPDCPMLDVLDAQRPKNVS